MEELRSMPIDDPNSLDLDLVDVPLRPASKVRRGSAASLGKKRMSGIALAASELALATDATGGSGAAAGEARKNNSSGYVEVVGHDDSSGVSAKAGRGGSAGGGGTGARQRTRRKSQAALQATIGEGDVNLGGQAQASEQIAPVSTMETSLGGTASAQKGPGDDQWVEAPAALSSHRPSLVLEGYTPGGSSGTDSAIGSRGSISLDNAPHMDGTDLVC